MPYTRLHASQIQGAVEVAPAGHAVSAALASAPEDVSGELVRFIGVAPFCARGHAKRLTGAAVFEIQALY